MSDVRIDALFVKHCAATITIQEWRELQELLLAENYHYGDMLPGYLCPNQKCRKPLMFSWHDGPVCWHANGGCGWHSSFLIAYALHKS